MARYKLLVEGSDDQDFFAAYCKLLGLSNVEVFPPRTLDSSTGDGCSNLIKNLPILLGQIKAGDVDKLGIILDADYSPDNNGGFIKRFDLVTDELTKFGYMNPKNPNFKMGDIFSHPDGLPAIGLWVMPDHQSDGMLEGFVEGMISDETQVSLLKHADQSINSLPQTLFNQALHLVKARISTWRSWQKRPGCSLQKILRDGILDRSKAANFENWLMKVFK